jgi:cytochrome P450
MLSSLASYFHGQLPPGPKNGPLGIRHIYRCNTRPLAFYERLASYGDIATFRMFGVRAYFLNSPELIWEVLRDTETRFRKLPRNLKMMSRGLGSGLLSTQGSEWIANRRLVQPAFSSRSNAAIIDKVAPYVDRALSRWSDQRDCELFTELDRLTIGVAAGGLLGVTIEQDALRIGQAARMLSDSWAHSLRQVFPMPAWMPFSRQCQEAKAIRFLRSAVDQIITHHEQRNGSERNLVSHLLAAYSAEPDDLHKNRERLIDQLLTILVAAYHASTVTLCWTLYLLSKHPDIGDQVAEEIENVIGDRIPTFTDIDNLKFTECVLKESMRIYPSAWEMFPRQAIQTTTLGEWTIPRGAWIFMSPYITHRDERFFENPLKFDPGRWSPHRIGSIDPRAYFPFGGGRHLCVGKDMAMSQNTLMLAMIVRRFKVHFAATEHVPSPLPPMALVPRDPMWITLEPQHANVLVSV